MMQIKKQTEIVQLYFSTIARRPNGSSDASSEHAAERGRVNSTRQARAHLTILALQQQEYSLEIMN